MFNNDIYRSTKKKLSEIINFPPPKGYEELNFYLKQFYRTRSPFHNIYILHETVKRIKQKCLRTTQIIPGAQREAIKVSSLVFVISQIYGFAHAVGHQGNATRRIPETKSYRSKQMRGNSPVIGRLPDNNPSRRARARGSEVLNRRHSLCNCDRIETAVSQETMAPHNGENDRVIKALGNKVNAPRRRRIPVDDGLRRSRARFGVSTMREIMTRCYVRHLSVELGNLLFPQGPVVFLPVVALKRGSLNIANIFCCCCSWCQRTRHFVSYIVIHRR